jgi:hypothetical protein
MNQENFQPPAATVKKNTSGGLFRHEIVLHHDEVEGHAGARRKRYFTHEDAKDTTVRRGFAKLPQGMQRLKQILPEATDGIAKMEIPTTVTSANRSVAGRKSACRFLTADRKGNPSAL